MIFLLDISYDYINNQIIRHIKDRNDYKQIKDTYYPKIYVIGKDTDKHILSSLPGVKETYVEEKFLLDGKKEKAIRLTVEGKQIYNIASILEEKYRLYNINVDIVRKYLIEKNLFPTAKLNNYNETEDGQYSIDYEFPPIKSIDLSIIIKNKKGIKTYNDKIVSILIGDTIIDGKESDIIQDLDKLIHKLDPDLIFTETGDSFEFPFLYHRASLYGINLQLGRDKACGYFVGKEKSYFSYGRILYKPKAQLLSGRLHIDKSSFIFKEGGLAGLIDISRISGIPLQELSRLSPGSAITALQTNQAIKDNILIPWKRNIAEKWKTAEQMLISDRGALVIEPKVGLHENVFELDFNSLFPNIMVNKNISPETILCKCCPDSNMRVPFINYHICQKHTGLIPKTIKPLIERRVIYKKLMKEEVIACNISKAKEYENRQNILKWLLVTSFGYMGYNKAIFGRIECHESITAYARDILLRAIEIADDIGFEILHGIVDCLWVRGENPEKLCNIISKEIGINLELKGKFNWIVFIPNKTRINNTNRTNNINENNLVGSLNRYYGALDNGEIKIRGIEMRRSDCPLIIRNLQYDMISKLAEAKNKYEFYLKIPESIIILKKYISKVFCGESKLEDLIFQINISRNCEDYIQFNNQVAALRQLKNEGIEKRPGQSVRFIITDHKSKDYQKRIILPELVDGDTQYDKIKYCNYLLNAAESILLPFGYTNLKLDQIIKGKIQKKLDNF